MDVTREDNLAEMRRHRNRLQKVIDSYAFQSVGEGTTVRDLMDVSTELRWLAIGMEQRWKRY